jgi:hypothetical protein
MWPSSAPQIAVLVADSYQRGAGLSAATVLLSKEGPEGIMNRVGVARAAEDSMQARFESLQAGPGRG